MGICPYCESELHLADFYKKVQGKFLGKKTTKLEFQGETINVGLMAFSQMYVCPHCNKILGFSERQRKS